MTMGTFCLGGLETAPLSRNGTQVTQCPLTQRQDTEMFGGVRIKETEEISIKLVTPQICFGSAVGGQWLSRALLTLSV
jgi:hypothetical protein